MRKLLLLHGALGSAANFNLLTQYLLNDFEIHTLTFKGHDGGIIPENDFTMAHFANEVITYLEEKNINQISIFGYSMGGYVGLYLAKYFPEKVEKLYTLATNLNWTVEGAVKEAAMLNPSLIKEKVPKYAAALEDLHGNNWEILLEKTAKMILNLGKNPTLKPCDFEAIAIPVLLSVGDKDVMVTIEETTNVFRKLSNAQLYIMPNTIHPIEKVNVSALAYQIKLFF